MRLHIAMISDHASPLEVMGGVDAGGQNLYVDQVARRLGAMGHAVDVFTRRTSPAQATAVDLAPNVRVIHVPAGPDHAVPKEELLPYMGDFSRWLVDFARQQPQPYDISHANFFMSGMASMALRRSLGVP